MAPATRDLRGRRSGARAGITPSLGALCGLVLAAAPVTAADSPRLELRPQQASYWCWAAATEMAIRGLRSVELPTQLEMAAAHFPGLECDQDTCPDRISPECDLTGFPQLQRWGVIAELAAPGAPLSWDRLRCESDARRPVPYLVRYLWNGAWDGEGHALVARRTGWLRQIPVISVLDPAPRCEGERRLETYSYWSASAGHDHWLDYYGLRLDASASIACVESEQPPAETVPRSTAELLGWIAGALRESSWAGEELLASDLSNLSCPIANRLPVAGMRAVDLVSTAFPQGAPFPVRDSRLVRFLCQGTSTLSVVLEGSGGAEDRLAEIGEPNWTRQVTGALAELYRARHPGAADEKDQSLAAWVLSDAAVDALEVRIPGLGLRLLRIREAGGAEHWLVPGDAGSDAHGQRKMHSVESAALADSLRSLADRWRPASPS